MLGLKGTAMLSEVWQICGLAGVEILCSEAKPHIIGGLCKGMELAEEGFVSMGSPCDFSSSFQHKYLFSACRETGY